MSLRIDQRALTFFDQTIEKNTFGLDGSKIGDVSIELMSKNIDLLDLHLRFVLQIVVKTLKFLSNLVGLSSMGIEAFEKLPSRMKNHFVSNKTQHRSMSIFARRERSSHACSR